MSGKHRGMYLLALPDERNKRRHWPWHWSWATGLTRHYWPQVYVLLSCVLYYWPQVRTLSRHANPHPRPPERDKHGRVEPYYTYIHVYTCIHRCIHIYIYIYIYIYTHILYTSYHDYYTNRGFQEYCWRVLFGHPSILRIAKQLNTIHKTHSRNKVSDSKNG